MLVLRNHIYILIVPICITISMVAQELDFIKGLPILDEGLVKEAVKVVGGMGFNLPAPMSSTPSQEVYSSPLSDGVDYDDPNKICLSPNLKLPKKAANEVWAVYGKRGMGKSYFLGKLLEELNKFDDVVFVVMDVMGAHSAMQMPGLTHVSMTQTRPNNIINRLANGDSIIVNMKGGDIDQIRTYVTEFSNIMSRSSFGPKTGKSCMVALEECHNFVGQGAAMGKHDIRQQCRGSVDKLIREGRQDGIGICLVSQSVATVMANVRRQCEIKVIFGVKDHTDLKALKLSIVGRSSKEVDDILNTVFNFDIGQFICITTLYIGGRGIIIDKTSPRKTEHSGKSFLEGNNEPIQTNFEPISLTDSMTFDDDDVLGFGADDDDEDDDEPVVIATPDGVKLIDYKYVIMYSLIGVAVLGFVTVLIKSYLNKKDAERESSIQEQLRLERARMRSLEEQNQQEAAEGQVSDFTNILDEFDQENSPLPSYFGE